MARAGAGAPDARAAGNRRNYRNRRNPRGRGLFRSEVGELWKVVVLKEVIWGELTNSVGPSVALTGGGGAAERGGEREVVTRRGVAAKGAARSVRRQEVWAARGWRDKSRETRWLCVRRE